MDMIASITEDGVLGGTSYTLTLENEGLAMEFDEDFEMSEEMTALAEETIEGIISGDIVPLPEEEAAEEDAADAEEETEEESGD